MVVIFSTFFSSTKAQNPFKEGLMPIKAEMVSETNELFQKFVDLSKLNTNDIKSIELIKYKENSLYSFNIVYFTKQVYTTTIGIYYTNSNSYAIFYQNKFVEKDGSIKFDCYSETNEYLYSTNTDGKKFDMYFNSNLTGKTPFSICMDNQEENFEDTFVGWVTWNTNPSVQILAAANCLGCVNGWWHNNGC